MRTIRYPRSGIIQPPGCSQRPPPPWRINRDSPQAENLVGWWPMVGANASSGSGITWDHTGNLGPTTATATNGVIDGQVNFAGGNASITNDHTFGPVYKNTVSGSQGSVTIADNSLFDMTAEFTLSAWFKMTETTKNGTFHSILCKDVGSVQYQMTIFDDNVNGPFVQARIGGATKTAEPLTGNSKDGNWHLIVATYDGANLILWLDFFSKTTTAATGTIATSASNLVIGADKNGNSLVGSIADARVYNIGKTPGQVWAMYDPRTRFDLYWSPATKVFSFGQVSAVTAVFRRTLSHVGTRIGSRQTHRT